MVIHETFVNLFDFSIIKDIPASTISTCEISLRQHSKHMMKAACRLGLQRCKPNLQTALNPPRNYLTQRPGVDRDQSHIPEIYFIKSMGVLPLHPGDFSSTPSSYHSSPLKWEDFLCNFLSLRNDCLHTAVLTYPQQCNPVF